MKDIILKQVEKYSNNNEYDKIISTITNFARHKKDYELSGQLARAYNNIKQYNKAIDILQSFNEQGINDPMWVYRLAYSYCVGTKEYYKAQKYIENILNNVKDEKADDEVYTDLSDFLVECLEHDINNLSFKKRVENFWIWFAENEEKLSDMIDSMNNNTVTNSNEIISFVNFGVSLISDKLHFNFGGNYEFRFSCNMKSYIFYITPYLVSKMPEKFKDKWTFSPFLMGQSDGYSMNLPNSDQLVNISEIFVSVSYDSKIPQANFNLQFYNEHISELDDNTAYNFFYIMTHFAIGDATSYLYIDKEFKNYDKYLSDKKLDNMIPLTNLNQNIIDTLKENDRKFFTNPKDRFITFKMNREHDETSPLRYEITYSTTSYQELQNEYFSNINKINLALLKMGAAAGYIIIQDNEGINQDTLTNSQKISDEIVKQTATINIGKSLGNYIYLDFIIYDMKEFLEKTPAIFKKYPYKFYFSFFRHNSDIVSYNQL